MKNTILRTVIIYLILCMAVPAALAEGGNVISLHQEAEAQLEKELGAFEITAMQRELAKTNEAGYSVLDAGRGNPNWINTQTRYAFTRFMNFAIGECELDMSQGSMAGHGKLEGVGERFDAAMNPENPTDAFLIAAVDYCVNTLGLDKDILLKELGDAVIGDYYPSPSRCLPCTEAIQNAYLQSTLYGGKDLSAETQIFPTEGGSAAMVYIFEALSHNKLLKAGDQIAIGLYHTSGLSTPSQVFMDMLALSHLIYEAEDPYIKLANDTVRARYTALMNALGLPADDSAQNARYYTLVDVLAIASARYGEDFADWLKDSRTEIDFLNDLAGKKGVVLMYGPGFNASEGTVRISLANLYTEDYVEIASRLFELLDEYYTEYETEAVPDAA